MTTTATFSFPAGGIAVVIGAGGGIGRALVGELSANSRFDHVVGFGRHSAPPLDLTDEPSIAKAAAHVRALEAAVRLVIVASGYLHDNHNKPEKRLRDLDAAYLARSFALNAIGPALIMKHFLPLLPRQGKAVFAVLSARVGSIGDNQLGGWHGYRASKAALNQLLRTASIELARTAPEAACIALHPGTVNTSLSSPFAKSGLDVQPPELAARRLLHVIDNLGLAATGSFHDQQGRPIPW